MLIYGSEKSKYSIYIYDRSDGRELNMFKSRLVYMRTQSYTYVKLLIVHMGMKC